jgi:hypothetical protein
MSSFYLFCFFIVVHSSFISSLLIFISFPLFPFIIFLSFNSIFLSYSFLCLVSSLWLMKTLINTKQQNSCWELRKRHSKRGKGCKEQGGSAMPSSLSEHVQYNWKHLLLTAVLYCIASAARTCFTLMFRIVFWDVLPCKIIVDRRFRGANCLHQVWSLMMETVRTSETSADNYFTRQYIPEDNSEHHTRRRENLEISQCFTLFNTRKGLCSLSLCAIFLRSPPPSHVSASNGQRGSQLFCVHCTIAYL